jgi:hypothetical protein
MTQSWLRSWPAQHPLLALLELLAPSAQAPVRLVPVQALLPQAPVPPLPGRPQALARPSLESWLPGPRQKAPLAGPVLLARPGLVPQRRPPQHRSLAPRWPGTHSAR